MRPCKQNLLTVAMASKLALAGLALFAAAAPEPPHRLFSSAGSQGYHLYERFDQCDARWAADEMGVPGPGERASICREGCAMSCVAMVLAALEAPVVGVNGSRAATTPGTFNAWLEANNGYRCDGGDCNNLVLEAPEALAGAPRLSLIGEAPKGTFADIAGGIANGSVAHVAHVRNNSHFVLLSGVRNGTHFMVQDPGFNATDYAYADISDIITYRVGVRAVLPVPSYPTFKQCDARWGSDLIVDETVCAVGCLMSSIAAALHGAGYAAGTAAAPPPAVDPGTLNAWLRANGGYTKGNDLEEAVVPKIAPPGDVVWPPDAMQLNASAVGMRTLRGWLTRVDAATNASRPRVVIANVLHGRHFVLVVGWDAFDEDTLIVRDSGFDRTTYSHSRDVVGYRLFDVVRAPGADKPLPTIAEQFTVSTVEADTTGSKGIVVRQTLVSDQAAKRSKMVADGLLVQGHLMERMRCDLGNRSFNSMSGGPLPPPAQQTCSNQTMDPSGCTFNNFWDFGPGAVYAGVEVLQVAGASVPCDRWSYADDGGNEMAFWAAVAPDAATGSQVPVRSGKTYNAGGASSPYPLWQIDWVGFVPGPPPIAAFDPPSDLNCSWQPRQQQGQQGQQGVAGAQRMSVSAMLHRK